jgi:hypothetical protein
MSKEPDFSLAIVDETKIVGYLLNPDHFQDAASTSFWKLSDSGLRIGERSAPPCFCTPALTLVWN